MNRILLALVVSAPLASACAGPSSTAGSPSTSSQAVASAEPKKQRVICRTEKPIGSNIAQTICRTKDQMDAESQAAQDALRALPKSAPGQKD